MSSLKSRKNIRIPFNLNCAAVSKFYYKGTNNGRVGPVIKIPSNSKRLTTVYNIRRGTRTIRRGIARLGAGTQGIVYLACTTPTCDKGNNIVIKVSPFDMSFSNSKQTPKIEYEIQKAVFKVAPRHVPAIYKIIECNDFVGVEAFANRKSFFNYHKQFVCFSEYGRGGDLKVWMRKMIARLNDSDLARMVLQIVQTLQRITTKYPEFRHNDLHLGNIFVDDSKDDPRLMIADFGLARLKAAGSNPIVNSGTHRMYGISSKTSIKYDTHLFLNSIYAEINQVSTGFPETMKFLMRMLPRGYYGVSSAFLNEFRLREGAPTTALPTYAQILNDPFIRVTARSASPRSVSSPRIVSHSPSSPAGAARNAADIARNTLSGMPGVSVSTTTKPSAAEFIKMSPRSRAKFMSSNKPRNRNASRAFVARNKLKSGKERLTARRAPAKTEYLAVPSGTVGKRVPTRARRSPPRPRSGSTNSTPSPSAVRSRSRNAEPAPRTRTSGSTLAPMTTRERTALRTAIRTAWATRGPRVARTPADKRAARFLNQYMSVVTSPGKIRPSVLRAHLAQKGFSEANAKKYTKNWVNKWVESRRNVSAAVRSLAKGHANLVKRGYPENIAVVARRRVAMKLAKGTNGRVRSGRTLLASKKKPELVTLARRYGITGAEKMTKNRIVNALFG